LSGRSINKKKVFSNNKERINIIRYNITDTLVTWISHFLHYGWYYSRSACNCHCNGLT